MHWNTGYQAEAMPLMRRFVETFKDTEVVCIPSSSCVAMVRDHYAKMASDYAWQMLGRAESLVRGVAPDGSVALRGGCELDDILAYWQGWLAYLQQRCLSRPASYASVGGEQAKVVIPLHSTEVSDWEGTDPWESSWSKYLQDQQVSPWK